MKFSCPDAPALDAYLEKKGFEDRQAHIRGKKEYLIWRENGLHKPTRFAKVFLSGKFVAGGADGTQLEEELLAAKLIQPD